MKPLSFNQLDSYLLQHQRNLSLMLFALLFVCFIGYLLSLAIRFTDADLWYHLEGGRYLLKSGHLYNPMVNSFIGETREFTNYFWGFQALVYLAWLGGGELALIVIKAIFFLICATFVAKILLNDRGFRSGSLLPLIAIGLIIALLCFRGHVLRPHLFSYALIPVFIYILQFRVRLYPVLPILTVLWVNTHGVEWVVGALICGSYFLQRLVNYYDNRPGETDGALTPLIWITACLPAMMISPNHINLVLTPFLHDSGLAVFIRELGAVSFSPVLNFSNGLNGNVLLLALLSLTTLSFLTVLGEWKKHTAAILMAAGGLVLLNMAIRFTWEWALLSTPLIAAGIDQWRRYELTSITTTWIVLFYLLIPFTFLSDIQQGLKYYPYNKYSLPYATTEFIRSKGIEGRYAISPSFAGYAEFRLTPANSIYMDMQFPPFTSLDAYEFLAATSSPHGLTGYVEKYRPDLMGIRTVREGFPADTARSLGYVPVFYDKHLVLYLDSNRHAALAENYELKVLNPFHPDRIRKDQLPDAIREMERMLEVVSTPDQTITLATMLVESGDLVRAEHHLARVEAEFPAASDTSYLRGKIAHLREDYLQAIHFYEIAIDSMDDTNLIQRNTAECYFLLGDQTRAYEYFSASINPFTDDSPTALVYYQFALTAVATGNDDEAIRLLRMISLFAADSEITPQVNALLKDLVSAH